MPMIMMMTPYLPCFKNRIFILDRFYQGPMGPAGFNGTHGIKGDKGECAIPNNIEVSFT